MRLLEEILVLQLRVEPVVEHLDGPVQRDVLGDYKVSHMSTDITAPVNSSVSRHRGLLTAAATGASWSRRRRRSHLAAEVVHHGERVALTLTREAGGVADPT